MEHLAIMQKGYIEKILSGEKTIESRFSIHRITPYRNISVGDKVYMQETGKPVTAVFEAGEVLFFHELSEEKVREIRLKYGKEICAEDAFWDRKKDARYATLIYIKEPRLTTPFRVCKHDRSAFKTVGNVRNELAIHPRAIIKHPHDCTNGKHYFIFDGDTHCQFCGHKFLGSETMIDRPDYSVIREVMRESMWNDEWFHTELDNVAKSKLHTIDRSDVKQILEKSVRSRRADDGRQTPYYGDPIYYAQHSLGCCCRKCLEKFYGISRDKPLTDEDMAYLTDLIMEFLKEHADGT